jgi:hypothetical protein
MAVVRIDRSANWRLEPTGACQLCGEASCRKYTPTAG